MGPTPVPSAYKLPGALLFMSITYKVGAPTDTGPIQKDKRHVGVIAYDPDIKVNDTTEQVVNRYLKEGPYIERFSAPGPTEVVFPKAQNAFFIGEFGGAGHESGKSREWTKVVTGDAVAGGLMLVYWNQSETNRGVFTAPPDDRFRDTAKPAIMKIYPGSPNFTIPVVLQALQAEKMTLLYYATHDGEMKGLKP
ncbi:MAG: hypothetical protein M1813_002317 [Trichoglossum hirsutum]|nr:MAG: hypothetical protein M1813_002317 [Trichoglossum hirsutum]